MGARIPYIVYGTAKYSCWYFVDAVTAEEAMDKVRDGEFNYYECQEYLENLSIDSAEPNV